VTYQSDILCESRMLVSRVADDDVPIRDTFHTRDCSIF
jgi:hypothetical protein